MQKVVTVGIINLASEKKCVTARVCFNWFGTAGKNNVTNEKLHISRPFSKTIAGLGTAYFISAIKMW